MMITMIKPWDFDPFFFGGVAGLEVTGFSGANWILSDFNIYIYICIPSGIAIENGHL